MILVERMFFLFLKACNSYLKFFFGGGGIFMHLLLIIFKLFPCCKSLTNVYFCIIVVLKLDLQEDLWIPNKIKSVFKAPMKRWNLESIDCSRVPFFSLCRMKVDWIKMIIKDSTQFCDVHTLGENQDNEVSLFWGKAVVKVWS